MRREMVDNRVLCEEQAGPTGVGQLTSLVFISQEPELNASIARYFKYVHHITITTYQLPLTTHQKSPIIIQNEVLINDQVYGIYPFWFAFGKKNNIQVYGFTYESTDGQNNLLDWQDFLGLQWQNSYQDSINPEKVPYFDSARGALHGVLKPHGGESLYDLAASFHMAFANASQYITRIKTSGKQVPAKFKPDVIEPGIARFKEFQQKEPRHHAFLSMLPEADQLFFAIKELESLLDELDGTGIQGTGELETLSRLLPLIQVQTSSIHSFFLNLEPFLQGAPQ
jgi:hypothetical protein